MSLPSLHVIGTGLLGTSLGLAASAAGYRVTLDDASPTALGLARDLGAGEARTPEAPDLVVVATPPDVAAAVIVSSLRAWPEATVTDIASVKGTILHAVASTVDRSELDRYIGCHPMAGREKSGPIAAREDLFHARPWVVCSDEDTPSTRLHQVVALAEATGASVVHLAPEFHDSAVARISHAPQVVSSLVAAQLVDMPFEGVALAGQGLRDVTRIAASDPRLWTQILSGNASEVAAVLADLRDDLDAVITALQAGPPVLAPIAAAIAAGNEGQDRIPGKHGGGPDKYSEVTVVVDDTPGSLGRLFADVGELGINIEDVRLDHGTGMKLGIVDLSVVPALAHELVIGLTSRGWRVPESRLEQEGQE